MSLCVQGPSNGVRLAPVCLWKHSLVATTGRDSHARRRLHSLARFLKCFSREIIASSLCSGTPAASTMWPTSLSPAVPATCTVNLHVPRKPRALHCVQPPPAVRFLDVHILTCHADDESKSSGPRVFRWSIMTPLREEKMGLGRSGQKSYPRKVANLFLPNPRHDCVHRCTKRSCWLFQLALEDTKPVREASIGG